VCPLPILKKKIKIKLKRKRKIKISSCPHITTRSSLCVPPSSSEEKNEFTTHTLLVRVFGELRKVTN